MPPTVSGQALCQRISTEDTTSLQAVCVAVTVLGHRMRYYSINVRVMPGRFWVLGWVGGGVGGGGYMAVTT